MIQEFEPLIDYYIYIIFIKYYENDLNLIKIAIIDDDSYLLFKEYYEHNNEILEIIELKYASFKKNFSLF